jgi:hypothetical protein
VLKGLTVFAPHHERFEVPCEVLGKLITAHGVSQELTARDTEQGSNQQLSIRLRRRHTREGQSVAESGDSLRE